MNVELATQTSRMDWKSGKEQELWEYVQGRLGEGCQVGLAIKEFAEKHNIKWLTARQRYYQFNRSRDGQGQSLQFDGAGAPDRTDGGAPDRTDRGAVSDGQAVQGASRERGDGKISARRGGQGLSDDSADTMIRAFDQESDGPKAMPLTSGTRRRRPRARRDSDEILQDIAGFLRNAAGLPSLNLAGFLNGLHAMSALASDGLEVARAREELEARKAEIERMKGETSTLKEEVAAFRNRLAGLKEQYETLNFLVNDWFNLQSVDKVTSLGDFGRRLKYQVDQFGSVVKVLMK